MCPSLLLIVSSKATVDVRDLVLFLCRRYIGVGEGGHYMDTKGSASEDS